MHIILLDMGKNKDVTLTKTNLVFLGIIYFWTKDWRNVINRFICCLDVFPLEFDCCFSNLRYKRLCEIFTNIDMKLSI